MDRKQIVVADSNEVLEEQDIEYWSHATAKEKLQTITYLRECVYGPEATTGRLQRCQIMILTKDDLIMNKKASGRSMDIADTERLEKYR
jgi:hypothetical protein